MEYITTKKPIQVSPCGAITVSIPIVVARTLGISAETLLLLKVSGEEITLKKMSEGIA